MIRINKSTVYHLGQLDEAIVKGIESIGRYKLWGWDVPDWGQTDLVFDDNEGGSRMGMTITIYPVDKEETDD